MPSPKVFAIGFNKTATTSLTKILQQFGFNTLHHGVWHYWIRDGNFGKINQYDALTDGQAKDFRVLDERYPGSKFILNTRPLQSWLTSRWCHVQTNKNTKRSNWTQNGSDDIAEWALKREDYHSDVLEYFKDRPSDFCVLDLQTMNAKQVNTSLHGLLDSIAKKKPVLNNIPRSNPSNNNMKKQGKQAVSEALTRIGMPEEQWNEPLVTQYFKDGNYPENIEEMLYVRFTNKHNWYQAFRKDLVEKYKK